MSRSKIEWTEHTWNPVRGCSRVSEGCRNCYAERWAVGPYGAGSPVTGEKFAVFGNSGPRWTGKVELIESALDIPLRRKKPTTYFVNSMSDLFHESLTDEAIDRVFAVMALCPQHTFQVLTKRAERMRTYITDTNIHGIGLGADVILRISDRLDKAPIELRRSWPLPNVRLGISAEDQPTADARIVQLLDISAVVRFVSLEPLLGPIDLQHLYIGLDQVIVGGESGPGARPMHPDWVRSIRDQCVAAGVPFFFKQWGNHSPVLNDANEERMLRTDKKFAGRTLDGRTWDEQPRTA